MKWTPEADAARLKAFNELENQVCRVALFCRLQAYLAEVTVGETSRNLTDTEATLIEFIAYETQREAQKLKEDFYRANASGRVTA